MTAGRLCAQKDPRFFAEVAKQVRRTVPDVQFVWIGEGDVRLAEELRAADIRVTGWVQPPALIDELDKGGVYLHTAAWEGFPLSVLDASARGLPVVARAIPAFEGIAISQVDSVDRAVEALIRLLSSSKELETNRKNTELALNAMNSESQGSALRLMYASLSAGPVGDKRCYDAGTS